MEDKFYTIKIIAKIYKLGPKKLYNFCRKMGYLNDLNYPTKKSLDEGLCYTVSSQYGPKPCFTLKGRIDLIRTINKNKIAMLYLDVESNLSAAAFERITNRRPL